MAFCRRSSRVRAHFQRFVCRSFDDLTIEICLVKLAKGNSHVGNNTNHPIPKKCPPNGYVSTFGIVSVPMSFVAQIWLHQRYTNEKKTDTNDISSASTVIVYLYRIAGSLFSFAYLVCSRAVRTHTHRQRHGTHRVVIDNVGKFTWKMTCDRIERLVKRFYARTNRIDRFAFVKQNELFHLHSPRTGLCALHVNVPRTPYTHSHQSTTTIRPICTLTKTMRNSFRTLACVCVCVFVE